MRIRGLLVAAVLLAALGGLLYWSNKKKKADEAKPLSDIVKIFNFESGDIQKIEIRRKDSEPAVLEKNKEGQWTITAPKPYRADQDAVSTMVSTLASLNADKTIEDNPTDLAQYGLASPALEITITKKDGKTAKLYVGDEVPTGSGSFVRAEGDPKVYTVAQYNKSSFDKSVNDLRDRRLVVFDQDKITRVELAAKGQTIEFGKNAKGDWAILKPKPMRADSIQVDELIRKLREAKFDPSVSAEEAKKAAAGFNSGTPVGVARITDNSGTQQLEVRKSKDDYYARGSAAEGFHKVTSDLGSALEKKLDDFRNKKVFDFGFSDVSKVEVRDGAKTTVFQKSGDKWMSGSQEMEAAGVQSLIDKFRDASAVKFPDVAFPGAAMEVSITYGASTEKVLFAKAGGKTLAKRDNEPQVYELDEKALEDIQKALSDVKPAQPPKDEKKKK